MLFNYKKDIENGETEYNFNLVITWKDYAVIALSMIIIYAQEIYAFIKGLFNV